MATVAQLTPTCHMQGSVDASIEAEVQQALVKIFEPLESTPEQVLPIRPQKKALTQKELAQAIYAKMTSHRYCRRRPENVDKFIQQIKKAIETNQPISITLGHGPLKNPNNAHVQSVDWAELFSYIQLFRLHQAVQVFHKPGLCIDILTDDSRAAYANHIPQNWMNSYAKSVRILSQSQSFQGVFRSVTPITQSDLFSEIEPFLEESHEAVQRWQADPDNQEDLSRRVIYAIRNRPASLWKEKLPETERQLEAYDSVLRYMAYHRAEQQAGIWSQPDTLYYRYSHHPGHYQAYTLRRGSISQPWQGRGALTQLENGKWDVTLLTHGHSAVQPVKIQQVTVQQAGFGQDVFQTIPVLRALV
jgi:hypothetical protein